MEGRWEAELALPSLCNEYKLTRVSVSKNRNATVQASTNSLAASTATGTARMEPRATAFYMKPTTSEAHANRETRNECVRHRPWWQRNDPAVPTKWLKPSAETTEAAARATWGQGTTMGTNCQKIEQQGQVTTSWPGPVARGWVSGGACTAACRCGVRGGAGTEQRTEERRGERQRDARSEILWRNSCRKGELRAGVSSLGSAGGRRKVGSSGGGRWAAVAAATEGEQRQRPGDWVTLAGGSREKKERGRGLRARVWGCDCPSVRAKSPKRCQPFLHCEVLPLPMNCGLAINRTQCQLEKRHRVKVSKVLSVRPNERSRSFTVEIQRP
jgi:hypothetical protein